MRAAAVICAIAVLGCGGPPDAAKRSTVALGDAIHDLDLAVAPRVATAGAEAIAVARSSGTELQTRLEAYDRIMSPWVRLVGALDVARSAWLTLDAALVAWDEGDGEAAKWRRAAACVARTLPPLLEALRGVDVDPPDELEVAADGLAALASAACEDT